MPTGHKLTLTGKTNAGASVTAQVLTNVTLFNLDVLNNRLIVVADQGRYEYDINAATVFTVAIASGVYTIVIS